MGKGKKLYAASVKQLHCCGLFEISGLGFESSRPTWPNTTLPLAEEMLLQAEGFQNGSRGFLATTTTAEREEIAALKKLGFRKMVRWRNSNTGNVVTMWFKVPRRKRL